ncbi:tetratricopeptide repeat protein [Thiomicrospira microaerophila]|uniref:hypothetical protein n=1 Tax=Thiomicrospira microaerophila TaxID=406020 RepID=UPI00200FBF31|nr:hypothetical protein [Thiomicrospira microaerophila]UQB41504.1 tetratricopeptide repeat protein [Thiomicrospira microaerophila]
MKKNKSTDNDFFKFIQNKDSDKLVVFFSGVNAKSFMGYKLVEDFDCNKIFIRDVNKSWYHGNIENVSKDIDDLVDYIRSYADKFERENITFIGSSMGAYAALLIGLILNVGKVIAFGPQIYINKYLPNNPRDDSYIKYKNLIPFLTQSTNCVDIFIGANDIVDLYQVKDIDKRNVKIYKVFSQPHNVMYFLNKVGVLKEYIRCKIYNKVYEIKIEGCYLNSFNDEGYLESAVLEFFIKKDYVKSSIMFDCLIQTYPTVNAFWKYRGICSYHLNQYSDAVFFLKQAELIAFRDDELHYFLGLSFLQLKNYILATSEFQFSLEFAIEKKTSYFIKLSISFRERKKYGEAIRVLKESLKINSKNYGTYYQLAQNYKRLKEFNLAIKSLEIAQELKTGDETILKELVDLNKKITAE